MNTEKTNDMKTLFTILLCFTCLLSHSQETELTPKQKKRSDKIFTAKKILDVSKAITNEKRQYKTIDSLQNIIQKKDKIINDLQKEYTSTLKSIAFQNKVAIQASKDIDSINNEQLKTARKERFNWNLTHLYAGAESREFNFNQIEFNAEFMVELKRIHFGVKAFALPDINGTYEAGAGIKVRYKFW